MHRVDNNIDGHHCRYQRLWVMFYHHLLDHHIMGVMSCNSDLSFLVNNEEGDGTPTKRKK